jgi:uncharacterized membrane protein
MKTIHKDNPRWIKYLAIVFIVLGLFLRFHNLDLRPYWGDEAATSVEMHGYDYQSSEFQNKILNRIITAKELNEFLYPDSTTNVSDTINLIAKNEPQLSPLYFILDRFWVSIFGNSIAIIRSFSAVVGVMAIFSVYWFSLELFDSKMTAWIAMAIASVSPFHMLYSQEARVYSLWSLTVILSSLFFLRAVRQSRPVNWSIYCFLIILSLYTHLFSLFVYFGHLVFLLIYEKFRITKKLVNMLLVGMVALLGFSPWLVNFILNTSKGPSWGFDKIYKIPLYYLLHYYHNLGLFFADFNVGVISPKIAQFSYAFLLLGILTIVICALRFIYFKGENLPRTFLLSVLIMSFVPFFLKDLFLGGGVTQVIRYFVPCWLAIELIVAYWLSNKIQSSIKSSRVIYQGIGLSLLLIGLISGVLMTNSGFWWNKLEGNFNKQYAQQVIAKAKNPLLVTNNPYFPAVVSMSTLVDPKTKFLLFTPNSEIKIPPGESDVFLFLYNYSDELFKKFEKNYKLEHVPLKDSYPGGGINSKHFYRVITN